MTELTTFDFHGDRLDVVREHETIWISVRRICDALGLSFQPQSTKLKSKKWAGVTTIVTPSEGGPQSTLCIPHRALPMWLATIDRVDESIQEKLDRYQKDCADVLADHFLGKRGSGPEDALRTELAELRTLVYAMSCRSIEAAKPSIGPGAARTHILDPLKDIARVRAKAIGRNSPAAIQSLRASAERALRREVNFPPDRNMRWELFPVARLGDALCVLARMHGDARELARIAAGTAKQTRLALVPA